MLIIRHTLLYLFLFVHSIAISQTLIFGKVTNNKNQVLSFATISTDQGQSTFSSIDGEFLISIKKYPVQVTVTYIGYEAKRILIKNRDVLPLKVRMIPKEEKLTTLTLLSKGNLAIPIIKKAILNKKNNNPRNVLGTYQYKAYSTFKITEDNQATLNSVDTTDVTLKNILNRSHSFFSEKVSIYNYKKGENEKETVMATRMTGFHKPVYDILGLKVQSTSLYDKEYVIFNEQYAGPLSKNALNNYHYKILDTTKTIRPAYIVLFQPKKAKKIASLEGILYLDIETLAVQRVIVELKGELNVKAFHNYEYEENEKLWLPSEQSITIRPGIGTQKIALFGGQISVGRLSKNKKNQEENNTFLEASIDFFDFVSQPDTILKKSKSEIEITSEATNRSDTFWNQYRTKNITDTDQNSFTVVDSIVKAQNIERRIDVIQNFNVGYYPIGFFNFDLTYPLKLNNYEGLRVGLGGITNKKFSKNFRMEGYLVYSFKDNRFKYGIGAGILLNQNSGAWLNVNFKDDLRELGSLLYLTDRRVYSLFEPRLVNIPTYYRQRKWNTSLQYRIFPQLLSETEFSSTIIDQTSAYRFISSNTVFSSYTITESTFAFRWSPYSTFLKSPEGFKEITDGYPKITAQYTQGWKGVLESNFRYSKFGLKTEYMIKRLNQSNTGFLLEGAIALGDVPLTHLFHAYPNAPSKKTILRRFSVAGRRSFETMFFNEFFSDRLATLQIHHQLRPFNITNSFKPELIFITKYALGNINNPEDHLGIPVNSLQYLYQESGFEINKLFAGFGFSLAYRYGAYHLPKTSDNVAFKFTFYLKL